MFFNIMIMSYNSGGGGGNNDNNIGCSCSDPQETATSAAGVTSTPCCSTGGGGGGEASAELKLYQAFIFSVPIFFTLVLLFLFYLFYLRRRRVDWDSLRMRTSSSSFHASSESDDSSRAEMGGLKKEVREMLPIIVFKESFSVKDTQCSVCLGDYQAEERLQQIPACGHTFHMDCIDSWLSTHATCPLCRQSLLVSAKASCEAPDVQLDSNNISSNTQNGGELSVGNGSHPSEDSGRDNESCNIDQRILPRPVEEEETDAHNTDTEREMTTHNEH